MTSCPCNSTSTPSKPCAASTRRGACSRPIRPPLVASFLQRVFVLPNRRVVAQADLAELLEDTLYALREQRGTGVYPKSALEYLNDWAANDKGWLRKFYRRAPTSRTSTSRRPPSGRLPGW